MEQKTINIILDLQQTLDISLTEIRHGISHRVTPIQAMGVDIESWSCGPDSMPEWAQRAIAKWVVELWISARDACEPDQLLVIDNKFSHVLRRYSMGDIIAFRNAINDKQAC
ncbi:MAG: hypothetical protein ACC707_05060 [Thiohalomonadales bacterium]